MFLFFRRSLVRSLGIILNEIWIRCMRATTPCYSSIPYINLFIASCFFLHLLLLSFSRCFLLHFFCRNSFAIKMYVKVVERMKIGANMCNYLGEKQWEKKKNENVYIYFFHAYTLFSLSLSGSLSVVRLSLRSKEWGREKL